MTESCGNCGALLKEGMFSSNLPLNRRQLQFINLAVDDPLTTACNACGDQLLKDTRVALEDQAQQLRSQLRSALPLVPVVSLQQPMGWGYEPIGIITAQTVTGTGIFSDVASAFTDLFGTQSGTYNAKLREGENLCKEQLRAQALEAGGNAVVAVDVDYAEVGGQRAMLMVCMTGTAVKMFEYPGGNDGFFELTAAANRSAQRIRQIDAALKAPSY